MGRPLNDSPYLYGLHDPGGEHLMAERGLRGWILFTEELGADPNNQRGSDYSAWADQGFGIMVRLNHGYEPNGTIPNSSRYPDFSRRVANFVRASRGCHIWIIGNEMNFAVERPGVSLDWSTNPPRVLTHGEIILPQKYAACYTLCRNAIKSLPGHGADQVVTGAVAPWNIHTTYAGNQAGDWVQYQTDILKALGPSGCDGIAIHAYTHGADPNLVHTNVYMNPPFRNRQYNFRTYQDFMNGIPADMRHLPVYLTEADQNDAWQNVNRGWIQRAYGEIDWWNRQPATQVIRALILYRWSNVDRWGLDGKAALHEDFRQAMAHRYNWETALQVKPKVQPQPKPKVEPQPKLEPTPDTAVARPAIIDISHQLPRDDSKFIKRSSGDIKHLVVNHTAVRPEIGADRVAAAQRQRWPGILSQFFITGDGIIQRTNADDEVVARDQEWIFNSLNIYVAGNYDATVPNEAQVNSLAHLCAWLLELYDLKEDAIRGASEFIETHSPGLQWLEGARWKETLLTQVAKVPGSPTAPQDAIVAQLRTEIQGLQAQIQTLSNQVKQLTQDKASVASQVQTLQAQNNGLGLQIKDLGSTNSALKTQLAAAQADKRALQKRVSELEAQIAELAKADLMAAPPIRDVVNALPRHSTKKYETRALSAITALAIHHSAASGEIPPHNVAAYHVSRDWPGIGYHFYITADGTIYQCNRLESVSYHVGMANTYTAGICLAGRFMDGAAPPEGQMAAAVHLVAYLTQKLNIRLENVMGHRELPQTQTVCPGSDWLEGQRWKDQFIAQVKAKLG